MTKQNRFRRFFGDLSLRRKILLSLTAIITLIFGIVLLFITVNIQAQTKDLIEKDFWKTQASFRRAQSFRFEKLFEASILISEQPLFKAILELAKDTIDEQKSRTILFNLNEFRNLIQCDFIFVTNRAGTLLARTDRDKDFGKSYASLPFISRALSGSDPASAETWVEGEAVQLVVAVPILLGDEVFGTLTMGLHIKNSDAEELKKDAGSDVSFILAHKVIASTLEEEKQVDLMKATFERKDEIKKSMDDSTATRIVELYLKDETYLTSFFVLGGGEGGPRAYYAVSASLDQALAPLRQLQRRIIVIGLFAIILTFASGFFIARGITAPVKKLVQGIHRIGAGDFSYRIEVESADEIGMLAAAYNDMSAGLKERVEMEKFVSSSTLDMIKRSHEDGVQLGGERKIVTVLFSDIRGFTAFSEKVDPEEVIGMLNLYLSKQAKLVLKFNGVIDKYVGDELVAVFEGENMVDNAVLCAVEIQKEMTILHQQLDQKVRIGIGINSGLVVMGNMGSEERMDYTVLGSNVNLGARLCSMAEGGQIILSESSQRLMKIKIKNRPLPPIRVKGVENPVPIYEIVREQL